MIARSKGSLLVILAATLWGLAGTAAKFLFTVDSVEPLLLVQLRMGFSFLLLLAGLALFAPRLLRVPPAELRTIAIWGIAGTSMSQFTYFIAISETNVATGIFLQYLAPVLTALWAWLVEKRQVGGSVVAALVVALAGSVLLVFGGTSRMLVSPLGLAAGLASAAAFGFHTVFGQKIVGRISSWTLLIYGQGFGTLFWLTVNGVRALAGHSVLAGGALDRPAMWAFFAGFALFATVLPFGCYLIGLRTTPPTVALITGMLEPVVAGVAAYLLLGEVMKPGQILGGALTVAAVALLQARRSFAK